MGGVFPAKHQFSLNPFFHRYTTLTTNQVDQIKSRFEILSDSYTIETADIPTVFNCPKEEGESLLKFFDPMKKNNIDAYTFFIAFYLVSQGTLEEKIKKIFMLYDAENSLTLLKDEIVILLMNCAAAINLLTNAAGNQVMINVGDVEKKESEIFGDSKKICREDVIDCFTRNKEIIRILRYMSCIWKDDLRSVLMYDASGIEVDPDIEQEIRIDPIDEHIERIQNNLQNEEANPNEISPLEAQVRSMENAEITYQSAPPYIQASKNDAEVPDAELELEYVYGYNSQNMRNNLFYARSGDIVYPVATLGITLNSGQNTQKQFSEHRSEIKSIALHPTLDYVATGDIGSNPVILIWDSISLQCVARISGLLKEAVTNICFSKDGTLLAASGADLNHTVVIYEWEKIALLGPNLTAKPKKCSYANGLLSCTQTSKNYITCILYNPKGNQLIIAGVNDLYFLNLSDLSNIKLQRCSFTNWKPEILLCAAYLGESLITGGISGRLFVWSDKTVSSTVDAHKGAVNSIWVKSDKTGLITGGSDGKIVLWSNALKCESEIVIANNKLFNCVAPSIRSVCDSVDGKVLMGTRSGDIIELYIRGGKPKILMRSHFKNKLAGIAVNPTKPEIVTMGEDGIFAVWDIAGRKQKMYSKMDCGGNCVDISPKAEYIALGLMNGLIIILNGEKISSIASRKDINCGISILKFSPDSKVLAAGAENGKIILYDVQAGFKIKSNLKGCHKKVTQIDFLSNSSAIQVNCEDFTMYYFDIANGQQMLAGSTIYKAEKWATWTCSIGWPAVGIWPESADFCRVNTVARVNDEKLLITGDEAGQLKLFNYPCHIHDSSFRLYKGHSANISNIRFTPDSSMVFTTGSEDHCIFQWKLRFDRQGQEEFEATEAYKQQYLRGTKLIYLKVPNNRFTGSEESTVLMRGATKRVSLLMEGTGSLSNLDRSRTKNESSLVYNRPYLDHISETIPSSFVLSKNGGEIPDNNLNIRYVHGYRSSDMRNNIKWTKNGSLLYTVSGLAITVNENNEQSFFAQHDNEISSIALHPQGIIAATGELAAKEKSQLALIYVWNSETKEIITCLKGFHLKAVRHLRFSPNGSKLLSIGEDTDHSLALYDWANNRLLVVAKVDRLPITTCEFKSETEFVTCGIQHIKFWKVEGLKVLCVRGLMGVGEFEPQISVAFAFTNKICVTGTNTGNLLKWSDRSAKERISAHKGMVWAMLAKNNNLITGGQDGVLKIWEQKMDSPVTIVDLASEKCSFSPGIRAIDCNLVNTYAIGTKGGEIIKVQSGKPKIIMRGHYMGEIWGLAVAPSSLRFVTCGGDRTVRLYQIDKLLILKEFPDVDGRALDWSSNSEFIIYANINGKVYSLSAKNNLKTLSEIQSTFGKQQWIEDIKISPSNRMVAFGAHRGVSPIQVLKISESGTDMESLYVIDAKATSSITHLDWDTTSSYLVANSRNYELLFVHVPSQAPVPPSASKGLDWHTWTSTIGFPVQGISTKGVDILDINSCCRSNNRKLLASADDENGLKLFKYPALEGASYKTYRAHSYQITKVKFTYDDQYIISIGGKDNAVIIWGTDIEGSKALSEEEPACDEKNIEAYWEKQNSVQLLKDYQIDEKSDLVNILPWRLSSALPQPDGIIKMPLYQAFEPKIQIKLDYVFGYQSGKKKNNLHINNASVVYPAGSLGIVHDSASNIQKYYTDHERTICSIAFHPDSIRVATGETGDDPEIHIWESTTCAHLKRIKTNLTAGVGFMAFSPSGDTLAAVDIGKNYFLAVYHVQTSCLLVSTATLAPNILQIAYQTENDIITVGIKHCMFWNVNCHIVSAKKGIFRGRNAILGCVSGDGASGLAYTGNAVGEVYVWEKNNISFTKSVHEKALETIMVKESWIITGGQDGKIVILDKKLTRIGQIDLICSEFDLISNRIIALDYNGKDIAIGTTTSEIFYSHLEKSSSSLAFRTAKVLMRGHCAIGKNNTSKIYKIVALPNNDAITTIGEDTFLRVWDDHKQVKSLRFSSNPELETCIPRCIDLSLDNKFYVVGFNNGAVRVINADSMSVTAMARETRVTVMEVKISPDGKLVACGCSDGIIFILQIPDLKQLIEPFKSARSPILAIDWSLDSKIIRCNNEDYTVSYFSIETKAQIKEVTKLKNIQFSTNNSCITWQTQGIWENTPFGNSIKVVAKSNNQHDGYSILAAAGDVSGKIRLYRYPCIKLNSGYIEVGGHDNYCGGVSGIVFMKDDKFMVTCGSGDGCVMQWSLMQQKMAIN